MEQPAKLQRVCCDWQVEPSTRWQLPSRKDESRESRDSRVPAFETGIIHGRSRYGLPCPNFASLHLLGTTRPVSHLLGSCGSWRLPTMPLCLAQKHDHHD
jgi:hypothetical protein